MNTNLKNNAFGAVIVATALLASVGSANAGGQTHRMPADYGKTTPTYEIKVLGMPAADAPVTVQLVNEATG